MKPMQTQIDLSELKDLHLPTEPDFWPLALGWYVLMIGFLLFLALCFWLYKHHQNQPIPYALKELKKIKQAPTRTQLKLLSQLLKRVAFVRYPRQEIAPLSEDEWQNFLLASAPKVFPKKQAHQLAFAIYSEEAPNEALYKNCQNWIKIILKRH